MEKENKKIIVPTIIAVATLVLLAVGATYSYFTVTSQNNFGTKDLTAEIEDMASSVTLSQENSTLSLDISRVQMSEANAGTYYYASGSATPANIAKATVDGEGTYACDYTISITKSATNDLYTAFQGMSTKSTNQIYLDINGTKYDFNDSNLFPITHTGTLRGITQDSPQYIIANMRLYNKNVDQNALKGTDITLTFQVTNFNCVLQEAMPIYAIYTGDDFALRFYQNNDVVEVGDTYDGYYVSEIYTDLNNTNYTSIEDVPWYDKLSGLCNVKLVEEVAPQNTAYWFAGLVNTCQSDPLYIDIDKINTSQVKDMSYMFAYTNIIGGDGLPNNTLSNFNTSKVTNMEGMFYHAGISGGTNIDFTIFDTSKVTNMSRMFESAYANIDGINIDLSNFDVSNVTDMSYMFQGSGVYLSPDYGCNPYEDTDCELPESEGEELYFDLGDITSWDTRKVVDMTNMFNYAGFQSDFSLNLSTWQVPLVAYHDNFNTGVTAKVTAPTWVK